MEKEIESAVEKYLNFQSTVIISDTATDESTLTLSEKVKFHRFKNSGRRTAWLKGRGALKRLFRRYGQNEETGLLRFPHANYSLTHSGNYAIAIGHASTRVQGIGIDFEISRPVNANLKRFLLAPQESKCIAGHRLLRLWTAKEAVFKADPNNRKRRLRHYHLCAVREWRGEASAQNQTWQYLSLNILGGFLSIAVHV